MAKPQIVLCDTNVLIDLSKRKADVVQKLASIGTANVAVSAISAGEFMYGALNKADLASIIKGLKAVKIIHVNEEVSKKGLALIQDYGLSHTLALPDALTAATALIHKLPLYTLNRKDFRFIDGVHLYDE